LGRKTAHHGRAREAVFIERVLQPLRRDFPGLKIVFEHITTKEAAQYVRDADATTAATITAHHLLYNRNGRSRRATVRRALLGSVMPPGLPASFRRPIKPAARAPATRHGPLAGARAY
jgi:dihydroorotase-like cyclic amidohydrolase